MKSWISLLSIGLFLSACAAEVSPTPQPIVVLTPWTSPTPAPTSTPPPAAEIIPQPVSSPTPRTHAIAPGEDLGSLALKYNVPLGDLLAANPDIDPRMISIGTAIIIPSIGGDTPETVPQADEAGLTIQPAHCASTVDGGLTCFSQVDNDQETPVENVSLVFRILDNDQTEIANQTVFAPLNLIHPGASIPFSVNFLPPLPRLYSVQVTLASALTNVSLNSRYLNTSIEKTVVEISPDGNSALVSGDILVAPDQGDALTTWVLVTAYNSAGEVVGLRRWEDIAGIEAGQSRSFQIRVYSSAEKIETVSILSESRP